MLNVRVSDSDHFSGDLFVCVYVCACVSDGWMGGCMIINRNDLVFHLH